MKITRRAKKCLIWVVTIYLFLDLRLLLLIPNTVLFFTSRNRFVENGKCFQVNVFPKLNIGSDPVIAVFSEKNISQKVAASEDIFTRSYDRSGLFYEFELSAIFNSRSCADTLYWLHSGIGGGLGGTGKEIPMNSRVYKGILVSDYIHFARIGLYETHFKYGSDKGSDCDLKRFFVVRLPENQVAKIVKSMLARILLKFPSDDVRSFAIKCLSYQENFLSTYILVRCYSTYYKHKEIDQYSRYYHNSTIEALRGIVRNQNVRVVSRMLRRFKKRDIDEFQELNLFYLDSHIERYLTEYYFEDWFEKCFDEQEARSSITQVIDHMYPNLARKHKVGLRESLLSKREFFTDECLLFLIKAAKKRGVTEIAQHLIKDYDRKEDRRKIIQLIDYTYARISEPPITATMIQQTGGEGDSAYVPKNLDECLVELKKLLTEEDLEELKNIDEEKITWYKFGIGVWMRTNWKLWSESPLAKYFNKMGISNPYQMSEVIVTSFHRHLNNKDIDLEQQIENIKETEKANRMVR